MDIAGLQPHLDPDQRARIETGARLPTEQRIRELYALARTGTLLGLRPFCEAPDLAEVFTHLVEECQRAREPEHTKYVGGQSEVGHHVDSVELNENDLAHLKDAKIEPIDERAARRAVRAAAFRVLAQLANGPHGRDELKGDDVTEALRYLGHHGLATVHEGVYAITSAGAWARNLIASKD